MRTSKTAVSVQLEMEGDATDPPPPPPPLTVIFARHFIWLTCRYIFSSSNPWILAELQQALLQHPTTEREGLSEERSEERSEENYEQRSGEVIVVRVAMPSAAERKHVRELDTRHTPSVYPGDGPFGCRRLPCGDLLLFSRCSADARAILSHPCWSSLTVKNEPPPRFRDRSGSLLLRCCRLFLVLFLLLALPASPVSPGCCEIYGSRRPPVSSRRVDARRADRGQTLGAPGRSRKDPTKLIRRYVRLEYFCRPPQEADSKALRERGFCF